MFGLQHITLIEWDKDEIPYYECISSGILNEKNIIFEVASFIS